jgi:serine/threonine protein phosphatase PrpC
MGQARTGWSRRGWLGVIQVGLLALGLLLLCCLAVAMRVPAAKPVPSRAPRPEPVKAPIPEQDITRLYGLPSQPIESGDSCGLVDFASQPDEPLGHRSDSRVVVSYEDEAEEEETTSPLARILLSAKGDSDRGQTRPANDDSLLIMPKCSLFAVADGMGGYAGGQVASSLAVETVRQAFERKSFVGELRADKPIPRRGQELASSILQSNWAVCNARNATPALSKMGTTLVAARFSPNKQRVYIGHVGDSRCYRFRAGTLRQLTTDQTMGTIGLRGPRANDLLQAIGVTADLAIDLIVDKPLADDIYLLCSDGLPKMASDPEIQGILREERDLEAAVYGLIELANDRGGKDNVTVVLIKVIERAVRATLPISAAEMKAKGWSKLPNIALRDSVSPEDVTVVGSLPFDEPTTIGAVPAKGRRGTGRTS